MFPQVFNSYHSKGGHKEFPHLCGCAPTAAPKHFQQEWRANPKGMANTWYLHRQGTHIHTDIPNDGITRKNPLLCVSAPRGCWREPGTWQTPRSQHHGGTSQGRRAFPITPPLPQALLTVTKPTLSPQNPARTSPSPAP